MKFLKDRITPSILISSLALFVALGGASYAALGKNSVGSKQLKTNAVVTKKIKKNAVTSSKIKMNSITSSKIKANAILTGKITNDAVTGAKVKESSLGTVPNAADAARSALADLATNAENVNGYMTFKQTKFTATGGATAAAAEAAAPEHLMFTVDPITIYAKCYTDDSGPVTYATIYARTSENGVIFDSNEDYSEGDPFFDTTTLEEDSELLEASAGINNTDTDLDYHNGANFMTPSGASFVAGLGAAAKNGTLTGGDGVYGAGNVCLFNGNAIDFTG